MKFNRRFGGTYRLKLQGRSVSLKQDEITANRVPIGNAEIIFYFCRITRLYITQSKKIRKYQGSPMSNRIHREIVSDVSLLLL
jgi:hypothetical protein